VQHAAGDGLALVAQQVFGFFAEQALDIGHGSLS
jgi:hypothetical protein